MAKWKGTTLSHRKMRLYKLQSYISWTLYLTSRNFYESKGGRCIQACQQRYTTTLILRICVILQASTVSLHSITLSSYSCNALRWFSCDASETDVGVVPHGYVDNTERPVANASKTLSTIQKKYPQIEKEALAIIYALQKFNQLLYSRYFTLITDHKPPVSMFGPNTATPTQANNRLARWSLMLN